MGPGFAVWRAVAACFLVYMLLVLGSCLRCECRGAGPGLGLVQLYCSLSSPADVLVPGPVSQPSILQQAPAAKPGGPLLSAAE